MHGRPRPPKGNPSAAPVGVFAHRGPYRPNHLGVSRCRLLAVDGLNLHVADLDALSGSPILDIKPYLVEFAPRSSGHPADLGDRTHEPLLLRLHPTAGCSPSDRRPVISPGRGRRPGCGVPRGQRRARRRRRCPWTGRSAPR
ncbi:TrmO family methyltransferase domain-containing protein [Actinomadura alba]|uniref:TrmO family methyltransferase domain-containing protein n=1 Tax=Actinomadura alba TaxID=406431 RepID=UPI003CD057C8